MHNFVIEQSESYPVALLIKETAFNQHELETTYADYLHKKGINKGDLIFVALPYMESGKAPVAYIKEQLALILPDLVSVGVQCIYCADSNYFKVLTSSQKAEAHLGYILKSELENFEGIDTVLGVNHKSLFYNPANEPKLTLSLDTLAEHMTGSYQKLGADIIHSEYYPFDLSEIKEALDALHQFPELTCDIETFALDFDKAGIGTIGFAWDQHNGIAFAVDYRSLEDPAEGFYGERVFNAPVRVVLKNFFQSYKGNLKYHSSTFDVKVMAYELWMETFFDNEGLLTGMHTLTRDFDDTKVIAYLATNSCAGNSLSLKDLAHEFAGNWAQSEIKDITRIPLAQLLRYNLIDALSTWYVYNKYMPQVIQAEQEELYRGLMLESQQTIVQIELTGMPLNPHSVANARNVLETTMAAFVTTLHKESSGFCKSPVKQLEEILTQENWQKDFDDRKGKAKNPDKIKPKDRTTFPDHIFNPNSDKQCRRLLYDIMGLPVIDMTEGKQPATGGDTLEKLVNHTQDPVYLRILDALTGYSTCSVILSSFIPAFEHAVQKGDGVTWLHGNFNLGGTKSGRLSSSQPNLQNLPAGNTGSKLKQSLGKLIKSCFQAPDDWLFCGADFNSLEDYVSALTTRDPNKLKVYLEGYDGHCLRAFSYFPDRLPGIIDTVESINSIKKLFPVVRQDSKGPTFALTYQGTWITLVKNLGFPEAIAKQIEANYHNLYEVSDLWVQDKIAEASKTGYVTLAFGLRLKTPMLQQTIRGYKRTPYEAAAEGRTAGNALGQSYGLLTNRSMNAFMKKVWASPYRNDIKPVAMIHDANYLLIRNRLDVLHWVNINLIGEMRWQELPELQHDQVKLGAELSVFYPSWEKEVVIPNEALPEIIEKLCVKST